MPSQLAVLCSIGRISAVWRVTIHRPLSCIPHSPYTARRPCDTQSRSEAFSSSIKIHTVQPQVRDVEAALQDALLDGFHDLVAARAATAGAVGKDGCPTAAAVEAASALRVILGRLPSAGVAASASIARACGALKAKGRLKCKPVAAGLQAMISSCGAHCEPGPKLAMLHLSLTLLANTSTHSS